MGWRRGNDHVEIDFARSGQFQGCRFQLEGHGDGAFPTPQRHQLTPPDHCGDRVELEGDRHLEDERVRPRLIDEQVDAGVMGGVMGGGDGRG
jgi:hypothetical protein